MQIPYNITSKLGKMIGLLSFAGGVAFLVLCFSITTEAFDRIRGIAVGLGLAASVIGCFLVIEPQSNNQQAFALHLGIASLPFLLGVAYVFPFKIDDSYISMRFASNLASGYGLVFNPGGPRVEGYTNLLLVLTEAILIRVGVHDIWAVKLLNTLCGLAIIFMIVLYTWQLTRFLAFISTVLTLLIASSSPFIIWTVSGMETTMFVFFICVGIISYLLYLHGRTKLWPLFVDLAFFLATLTRPEGLLFWAVTTGHTLLFGFTRRGMKSLSRDRIIGILSGLILLASYAFWKMIYFGSLLPLTYLAKQKPLHLYNFVEGSARLLGFLAINGNYLIAFLLLVGLILAVLRRTELKSPIWYVTGLGSAYLVYVLSHGFQIAMDDAYRFYVPLIPLMSLLLFEIVFAFFYAEIQRAQPVWTAMCLLTVMFITPLRFHDLGIAWTIDLNWGVHRYQVSARDVSIGLDKAHVALGRYLREHASPNAIIVLFDAGAIPYFSGLHAIDTWSLTDPWLVYMYRAQNLARSEYERKVIGDEIRSYILDKNPEYIIQDNLGLLADPEVQRLYEPVGIQFVYLEHYKCGQQQVCRYTLEPWRRRNAEEN